MAAAMDTNTPQNVLSEVRQFIQGVSRERPVNSENLTQSALCLLQTLPVARHAVLEYLCGVFDDAVTCHMQQLHGKNAKDVKTANLDSVIQDACGILLNFIKTNPRAWAPIISAWSLELLGRISSKHTHFQGVPLANSLNELLQQWMTCRPTKLLIEVATECFAAMVGGTPDTCVDSLLEATVKYSPYFDWVVAHIGSCFPTTIITRVLMCGLKDFCKFSSQSHDSEMVDDNIPKMASVVGILGHLASKHSQDIRHALMKLFEDSLQTDGDVIKKTTVPFLIHLASMSHMLLHVLTTDLLKALTPSVLNLLNKQFESWKSRHVNEYESFLGLVVLLVMRTETGALRVLNFLLDTASPVDTSSNSSDESLSPEVKDTCSILINRLLSEVQSAVFFKQREIPDVPFLCSLRGNTCELTKMLLQSEAPRSDWVLKLLSYVAMYSGEDCSCNVLADVIANSKNHSQFSKFIQLQSNIEVRLGDILPSTAMRITDLVGPDGVRHPDKLLHNILALIKWEKSSKISQKNRSSLTYCLQAQWKSFIPMISHESIDIAMVTLKILNEVGMPRNLTTDGILQLCSSLVLFFFQILEISDSRMAFGMFKVCHECVKKISDQSFIQCMLIRFIIEGIFIPEIGKLLGAKVDPSTLATEKQPTVSLLEENKKHGLTLTLPRSHSSVFHAGVIGSGLRPRVNLLRLTKDHITRNKQFVTDLLRICSHQQQTSDVAMETDQEHNHTPTKPHHQLVLSEDLCRMVGSLITELCTPDVLYNNRFWPEEESIRMTVERDLQVWRCFDDNPVIWDVMELYSGSSLAMCRCSPALKSLTAALMNHFESSREHSSRNSPKQMTAACRLVGCLGKSRLLPEPLKYVSELFPLVTSYEAFLLLLVVWRYMKENPPTEDPEEARTRICESRHTEIVRAILHSNIDKMGHLYPRFFSTLVT